MNVKKYKFFIYIIAIFSMLLNVVALLVVHEVFNSVIPVVNILSALVIIIVTFVTKIKIDIKQKAKQLHKHKDVQEKTITHNKINKTEEHKTIKDFIPKSTNTNTDLLENFLINISQEYNLAQGICFLKDKNNEFLSSAKYAYFAEEDPSSFKEGEGLNGQVVKNKKQILITDIPNNYIEILSGLGKSYPTEILITPIINDKNIVIGVLEIATLNKFSKHQLKEINENCKKIYKKIKNVE